MATDEKRTMYDYLEDVDSTDVYDSEYDDGICWDFLEEYEDEDIYDTCMREVQKRTYLVKKGKPYNTIADISGFVRRYMDILYPISQDHREPMESADPNDEDAVYHGVRLINAMMCGYASDDEYESLLKGIRIKDKEEVCE